MSHDLHAKHGSVAADGAPDAFESARPWTFEILAKTADVVDAVWLARLHELARPLHEVSLLLEFLKLIVQNHHDS